MTQEQAEIIAEAHNVYVDAETEQFNIGGGQAAVYGWQPIPDEWKAETMKD